MCTINRVTILWLLFLGFSLSANAQNYIFAQLTGSPVNTSGWNLQGAARVANVTSNNNSEILICPVNGASGAVFYNQPINLSLCDRWKAEFDFRMFDGTGADGLAFCFLDVPPSGFVSGAGLGIPSTANGLKVCFDTWNNCIPFDPANVHSNMPKIEIRWGAGYDECTSLPTKNNVSGGLSFIYLNNYSHAKITYDNGNIGVYVNDSLYLTGFQQFNYSGYLGFTASTGGYNDNHSIKNVVIYTEMPPSEAGNSIAFCPGESTQLGTAANADYVYSWLQDTGLSDANISNPVVTLNNTSAVAENHVYYVKTSFKSKPGCTSTDSVTIKVLPRPVVNFLMPDICLSDAIAPFKDSSYTGESSMLPFTYQWNFGDPAATVSNPNTANTANPSHRYSAADNYNVRLTVSNSGGCTDSLKKVFTVNGAVPKAAFTVINPQALCSNKAVQIRDQSNVNFGRITKVQIFWGDSTGVSYTDNEPATGKIYQHIYPPNQSALTANYTIRYMAFSGITCQDMKTLVIAVQASPHVVFAAISPLCENDEPYKITQATETIGLAGAFVYSGNGISTDGLLNPGQAANGITDLLAKFSAANSCEDSAYQQITIYPIPVVNAGPDLFMLEGGNITINASAAGTSLSFNWSPSAYLNNNAVLNPVASPVADILYALEVTGTGGCNVRDSLFVTVLKKPNIPNVFSPNGDGINDYWQIRYLDTYPGCVVDVFDRYGRQVFHSVGYDSPWNGTRKGGVLPAGVYYYIVNTKKYDKPFTGSVMIVR
ncbi:hypothetical protein BH10BAC3_BH10BAC3_08290 [soil metagenome]